ncbi:MAG TPA: hypothetical protein VLO07_09050, partial [Thermoanaerobaculia bacterium]|nr:hypothetical protein [Thermoanaerobaculia bacterium]
MTARGTGRRIRLFVLLTGALVLASLVPLLVSDLMLIRRNRRTLETLEEKYLTRSSSALADHVAAFYASGQERLKSAADSLRLAGQLTGKDPFTSADGPRILSAVLSGRMPLLALRGVNFSGSGSFVGPDIRFPQADYEYRKGFESARDGVVYEGKPFAMPEVGPVAVLARPVVDESHGELGVVEALVSWQPLVQEFRDEARREVRATLIDRSGEVLFPLSARARQRRGSLLIADFVRFPARLTRS